MIDNTRKMIKNIYKGLSRLQHIKRGVNLIGTRINKGYYRITQLDRNGADILTADWDTLIILDACRADVFRQENWIDGIFETRASKGTTSKEFLRNTFSSRTLHDTVYVTGNPFANILNKNIFYNIYPLYNTEWDEELGTVPPEKMTEMAEKAHQEHPNKKVIVHYMQPHMPFLGRTDFGSVLTWGGSYYPAESFDIDCFERAYRENVRIAISAVESLLDSISGKIIITSDHGELLGERQFPIPVRGFDHTDSLRLRELVEVPWFITSDGPRRETTSDSPKTDIRSDNVEDQLEALGYT